MFEKQNTCVNAIVLCFYYSSGLRHSDNEKEGGSQALASFTFRHVPADVRKPGTLNRLC